MRLKLFRGFSLFFTIFIGIGAFVGGICMLIKPDGSILHMEGMLVYFKVLPFSDVLFKDYIFSGISLIIVNGITNLITFIYLLLNKKIGYILTPIFGFTLMLWICIQFYMFPKNILDTLYFIFGILQLLCGYIALVSLNQENFKFNELDYPYINNTSDTLVIYFSRMKYTKKIAYEIANEAKCSIYEITTPERTNGTLGFWWCGRFGMHKWKMDINLDIDINKFSKIIIVTPIWVFRMCSPIRTFIIDNKDILNTKDVSIIFNHFNPWLPKKAISEVKSYININNITSFTTMLSHTFKKKNNCLSKS